MICLPDDCSTPSFDSSISPILSVNFAEFIPPLLSTISCLLPHNLHGCITCWACQGLSPLAGISSPVCRYPFTGCLKLRFHTLTSVAILFSSLSPAAPHCSIIRSHIPCHCLQYTNLFSGSLKNKYDKQMHKFGGSRFYRGESWLGGLANTVRLEQGRNSIRRCSVSRNAIRGNDLDTGVGINTLLLEQNLESRKKQCLHSAQILYLTKQVTRIVKEKELKQKEKKDCHFCCWKNI